jgi:predicted amidohydrolase YtcJ
VNTAALKAAKISARTPDPDNGRIVRDPRSRDAVGILEGAAADAMASLLPPPSDAERSRALFAAIAEAQRRGITSVQNFDGAAGDFDMLDAARKGGSVGIRVYTALPVDDARTDTDVAALDDVLARYPDDPLFKGGAATVDVDDIEPDALNKLVRLLDARGWQVMIEADSPEEVTMATAAFKHAERSNGRPERERRHRLEHQDRHFTAVGSKLALGSDWPNAPLAPMVVLQNATPFLTLAQALQAYTVNSAYATFDEARKGFIKPGMLADIVVLSDDIFALEPAKLKTVKVAYTIFDGKVVYPASTLTRFTN